MWRAVVLIPILVLVLGTPSRSTPESPGRSRLNAESVHALLDLIDSIAEKNPGYERTITGLKHLSEDARRQRLDELFGRNEHDPEIIAKLDAYLTTEARRIYFQRFTNVTPAHYRRALLSLPYERIDAPGDIATPYYELVSSRDAVRNLVDRLITEIDLEECRNTAVEWLPEADYVVPEIFLIYDNNAGSFTAAGRAFYNLYGGETARGLANADGKAIIAHELHHVFARPYLQVSRRQHDRWERERMDMVVRNMVAEGTAIHCNPPQGFKKELWQDRFTVSSLIAELNQEFLALEDGQVGESEFREWYGSTYQELPRTLLAEYASRRFGDARSDDVVHSHMSQRPDLVHALGWWMVSRISGEGKDPDAVKALLQNPYVLFSRYNEAIGEGDVGLRVDSRLVASSSRAHEH